MNKSMKNISVWAGALLFSAAISACGHDDGHDHGNAEELITTVLLTFTPSAGGAPVVVTTFNDADGDGGKDPVIDALVLTAGSYDVSVKFENRLATPAEDITLEVQDEADQHFVFFTGTAVNGPASAQVMPPLAHTYNDMDKNGLPLGLVNKIVATPGMGTLTVTLRHMPPVNGAAVKTATVPETVKTSGFGTIGGSNDVQVNFTTTVM
jgi:hypothetical protein